MTPVPPRIVVLIPCHNESDAIGQVVRDWRARLPQAMVVVYDNNSTDDTARRARDAGAVVRQERQQGKGHVVRRMFSDVDADIYVLVDGDNTYDAAAGPAMVRRLWDEQLDMVTGLRITDCRAAYRPGHVMGNQLLTGIVRRIYGDRIRDMLSGCRVFSRRFVKSFPALATGFETETEFTIHALDLAMPIDEMPIAYRERLTGSASKLRTYRDGLKILGMILRLVKEQRPLQTFYVTAMVLLGAGVGFGLPVVLDFVRTGLVPRLPTALLAMGLVLLSFLAQVCGLILDSVAYGRKEAKRLAYLAIPAPGPQLFSRCGGVMVSELEHNARPVRARLEEDRN